MARTSIATATSLALLATTPAVASSITGTVYILHARSSDGLQYVYVTGTPAGRPACAGSQPYYMIKDEHSDTGKAQFAILLAAQLAGKPVTIIGTDACTRWSDGEDILDVTLAPPNQ